MDIFELSMLYFILKTISTGLGYISLVMLIATVPSTQFIAVQLL